ncbi:hypothetical protein F5883DRAFT_719420 [Diaporthe sp. PMI_573]|nr:hypothetical protein F5883DRAFT_719420 [Diaporthaceae sp. PMI_573]
MATFDDLPFELLSIIAADSGLANRDRKQARLACGRLAAATTPFIFRRAYISWIKTDRDSFLALAATPHLAAHVEEVVWFEMECDWGNLQNLSSDLVGFTDVRADLVTTAQGLCGPPFTRPLEQSENHGYFNISSITSREPFQYTTEFSAQFKAAVAFMPKIHAFSSEPMPWRRTISTHADSYPLHVGLMKTHAAHGMDVPCSDFLRVFLDTINEEKGTIRGLFLEDSGEVHRWQHLRSLKLGYVDVKSTSTSFLYVIEAHVGSLRHLHLEQCRPAQSFARELSQLSGLQLCSLTISDSDIPKSGLISEKELLRFVHHGDTEDAKQAGKIARGKFVTHNRRPDNNVDDEPFEDYDSDSDHSSEWWSDSDSVPWL